MEITEVTDKLQAEYIVNRVNSSFRKGGHSATLTLNYLDMEENNETDIKTSNGEAQQKHLLGVISNFENTVGGGGGLNWLNGIPTLPLASAVVQVKQTVTGWVDTNHLVIPPAK